jgi:tRNA threonylcarbamoyladenosine biosynthesis protein TsaB
VSGLILAIDTTSEFGSVALLNGDRLIAEVLLHSPDGFAHILFEHLRVLFERHGIRPADVDCYAAASGPGSFTGVRVGLSAVKGLAEANSKPVVTVSNLRAIARGGSAAVRAVVLDARRGEVYAGLYDSSVNPIAPETVSKFSEWLDTLPDGPVEFLSTDFSPFRTALEKSPFSESPVTEVPRALAGAIARIAAAEFARGAATDPAAVDANYVRRSDAELFWRE